MEFEEGDGENMGAWTGPFELREDYRQLLGRHPDTWSCYQVAVSGAFRGL